MNTLIQQAIKDVIPSQEQETFLEWVLSGSGNTILKAVAGAGKTFTLRLATQVIKHTNPRASVQVLVFAKKNADEMKGTFPEGVFTSTLHSAWFGAYRKYQGAVQVDDKKVWNMLDIVLMNKYKEDVRRDKKQMYGAYVKKIVGYAKAEGIGYLVTNDTSTWEDLISYHGATLDSKGASYSEAIEIARDVLAASIKNKEVVDFDDMLFMPLVYDVTTWQKDWIFIDEAQDTNPVQRALVKRMMKRNGRLVAVGDPRQAIFGFRGATADALDQIQVSHNATVSPLSVTFRNPTSVVELAQTIVGDAIQAMPDAIEGEVNYMQQLPSDMLTPSDVILCRNTAPLVKAAYELIMNGIGCKILGRDIGAGLVKLIEKMKAKGIDALIDKLDAWRGRELARAQAKDEDSLIQMIEDKYESIMAIIEILSENERTVPALITKINGMFSDDVNGGKLITLATVHKSKGLEWDNVYIIRPDLMPSKWARQEWMQEQEENIQYVAYTRAMKTLNFVTEGEE
jgi:DNA helicase-2/ATP-dependent DNA helicase PcrA